MKAIKGDDSPYEPSSMVKSLVEVAIKFVLDVRWSKITIFSNGVHMAHLGILGEKVGDGNQGLTK